VARLRLLVPLQPETTTLEGGSASVESLVGD
jgi:hypothetical protein